MYFFVNDSYALKSPACWNAILAKPTGFIWRVLATCVPYILYMFTLHVASHAVAEGLQTWFLLLGTSSGCVGSSHMLQSPNCSPVDKWGGGGVGNLVMGQQHDTQPGMCGSLRG